MHLFRLILLSFAFAFSAQAFAQASGGGGGSSHYLSLNPAFIVNVSDESRVRHMQIQLQVKLKLPEMANYIEQHSPAIRHEMVMLFSNQPVAKIKTAQGKQQLMEEALAAIQKVLEENTGNPGVEAVYFTDLIIQ